MAKILMVDDDSDFLEASQTVLKSKGYTVITATTLTDAETKIKSENPDLILQDIMMENSDDGIAFAHKLRKEDIKTPLIMLSDISKVTGYSYGKCDEVLPCDDFIEKPVSPETLVEKVDAFLKK